MDASEQPYSIGQLEWPQSQDEQFDDQADAEIAAMEQSQYNDTVMGVWHNATGEVLSMNDEQQPTTVQLYICPVCHMTERVRVPIWREDVEGWGDETCPCPLCGGDGALTAAGWAVIVKMLQEKETP
jgi:hypothetical protein